jgi:cephalosporin-C deacetylase-like acetyl esterase
MDLDSFAEYFTTHNPITALVYDNRCVGATDGKPRFEFIPSFQMSDFQDAITYSQSLEEVNPQKIALWGTSYSGGNVLQVAAFDHLVKAVLSQNSMVSRVENAARLVSYHDA